MTLIEHTSAKTFKSYDECFSAIEWIVSTLYKSTSDIYDIILVDDGYKYRVCFESKQVNPVLFDNQKVMK